MKHSEEFVKIGTILIAYLTTESTEKKIQIFLIYIPHLISKTNFIQVEKHYD